MSEPTSVRAQVGRQISLAIENERGNLGALTNVLAARGVNLHALTLTGGIDHGYVRLVADDHATALEALAAAGHLAYEREVVLLVIPNAPGALAAVLELWAARDINLEYTYCAGGPEVSEGLVVVCVDDPQAAVAALQAHASA
ncbi:MAG: hypothetical protein K9N49_02465 [Candidatus Marinimicrobia bacterium]|nr:hypothetical protein [Candidatus Neomarinimicrobiota bacterium]